MKSEGEDRVEGYVCPLCGQTADLGRHYCGSGSGKLRRRREQNEDRKERTRRRSYIVGAAVASLLVLTFLMRLVGPFALRFLLIPALAYAAWYGYRRLRRTTDSELLRELLAQTGQDRATAERLVEAELRRSPGRSRREALEIALDKLSYERRR